MSQEIRIKKPIKLFQKSLLDTVGAVVVLSIVIFGYLQLPQGKAPSYSTDYSYLENTGQLLVAGSPLDSTKYEKVTVTEITDGDTIKAKRADDSVVSVRYIGIDCPEIKHQNEGTDEPYGLEATEANSWLVKDKSVFLLKDAGETDKYGRLLRYVYLEDGSMVNFVLIRLGYANIMTIPPNVAFQQQLFEGQELARKEGRGLFSASK